MEKSEVLFRALQEAVNAPLCHNTEEVYCCLHSALSSTENGCRISNLLFLFLHIQGAVAYAGSRLMALNVPCWKHDTAPFRGLTTETWRDFTALYPESKVGTLGTRVHNPPSFLCSLCWLLTLPCYFYIYLICMDGKGISELLWCLPVSIFFRYGPILYVGKSDNVSAEGHPPPLSSSFIAASTKLNRISNHGEHRRYSFSHVTVPSSVTGEEVTCFPIHRCERCYHWLKWRKECTEGSTGKFSISWERHCLPLCSAW